MEQAKSNTVGRFELTRPLGQEGRVSVYLAYDPRLNRNLTIRTADFSNLDAAARTRFDERVRAMAELRHTHLSTVLDSGQADGLDYLATTYVEGDLLSDVVRQNVGIEPKQVSLLVGKLALAIGHMHGAGLVHGHLSPDSIVVEKGGEPVITDLGLAPEFRSDSNDESSAFRNGFVAPEIRQKSDSDNSDSVALDQVAESALPQSDVYSLAAIGFFVLTGRPPKAASDVFHQAFLDGLDEEVAGEFKQSFSKALATNPDQRYGSARELATAMDHLFRATPRIHPVAVSTDNPPTEKPPADHSAADKPLDKPLDKPPAEQQEATTTTFKQFDSQEIEGSHVIHLHDESVHTMESLAQTKREIFAMVEQYNPKKLIINFAPVRFCSSETIGILIQLNTELKPRDTQLYLCGMRESIREVFRVLNLDGTVFEIRGTVTNALKSLD